MGKIFKFGCLGIIALIVLGIIIAALGGGGDEKTSSGSKGGDSKTEAPKELSKEGESSKVKIAVGTVESADTVGNDIVNEKAQGVYKIIELSITNGQKDAITLSGGSFKLVDDQGREFKYSSEAQIAMDVAAGGDSKFLLDELNPGLTQTGKIVFDIPADAKGLILKARGGMMGDEIELKVE